MAYVCAVHLTILLLAVNSTRFRILRSYMLLLKSPVLMRSYSQFKHKNPEREPNEQPMIQRNTVEAHFSEPLKCGLSAQVQVAFLLTTVHYSL